MNSSLSYNIPIGGSWNLAHICSLVPDSAVLLVVPAGCARIIHLSAAEIGLTGRFFTLAVSEQDTIMGGIEEKIIPAAEEVLSRFHPAVLFLITSCISDFIGLDREVYLRQLRADHPDVAFLDGRMDPINRCGATPPIVRLQDLFGSLMQKTGSVRAVNLIGSFLPPTDTQELIRHLRRNGYQIRHIASCQKIADLRQMGNSEWNLVLHPSARPAAMHLQQRLGIPWLDLCGCQSVTAAADIYAEVCQQMQIPAMDLTSDRSECAEALANLRTGAAGRNICVDDTYCSASYALAAELIRQKIPVARYFADGGTASLPAEDADARLAASQSQVIDTGDAAVARQEAAGTFQNPTALCLGESAAYLSHSRHYTAGLRFSGRFGYDGLRRAAAELLASAAQEAEQPGIHPGRGCSGVCRD